MVLATSLRRSSQSRVGSEDRRLSRQGVTVTTSRWPRALMRWIDPASTSVGCVMPGQVQWRTGVPGGEWPVG